MHLDELVAAADAADAPAPPHAESPPPRGQRCTEEQRWSVVCLNKLSWPSARIAEHLLIHRNTVREILARYAATGSPGSGARSGRPRATTEEEDTNLCLASRLAPFSPPRALVHSLGLAIDPRTADRHLQEGGLFGRVARCKPGLSEDTIRKRLSFAEGYNAMDWSQVLFSDEKIFWGEGFCGRAFVRRPVGAALDPQYVRTKKAHPVKVNVWACFAESGQGYIHIFNENLDANLQKQILVDNLFQSAGKLMDPAKEWFFLHDNDKKFKSKVVQEWLESKSVRCIDFPPYSPDLNPIENLWAVLACEVEKTHCPTVEALQDCVAEVWANACKPLMAELVASMPRRIAAVLVAKGKHTDY